MEIPGIAEKTATRLLGLARQILEDRASGGPASADSAEAPNIPEDGAGMDEEETAGSDAAGLGETTDRETADAVTTDAETADGDPTDGKTAEVATDVDPTVAPEESREGDA